MIWFVARQHISNQYTTENIYTRMLSNHVSTLRRLSTQLLIENYNQHGVQINFIQLQQPNETKKIIQFMDDYDIMLDSKMILNQVNYDHLITPTQFKKDKINSKY